MHETWSSTIVGRIEIQGRRLTGEVNSARRAREFIIIVEVRLGERSKSANAPIAESMRWVIGE